MTMFFPSTYPSSRSPWRNASRRAEIVEGETALRNPMRWTFFGCCASVTTATVSSITATRIGTAAFFIYASFRQFIYHEHGDLENSTTQCLEVSSPLELELIHRGRLAMPHSVVEVSGHIIDSLILPKVLDLIISLGADFEILEVHIGHRRADRSYARIQIDASSP